MAANHDHALNGRRVADGLIDDRFQGNNLAAVVADIGRDDHLGCAVRKTARERRRAEAGVHDGMNRAEPGTGQHRDRLLGNLRKVDRDAIALAHTEGFQRIGATAHLAIELAVGKHAFGVVFADPDQCDFVSPP